MPFAAYPNPPNPCSSMATASRHATAFGDTLQPGTNTIYACALDSAGNLSFDTGTFFGETVPPESAPLSVVAAAGNGVASVSWTPVENDPNGPLIEYVVYASGEFEGYVPMTQTTLLLSGLSNGVAYSFSVVPVNFFGEGPTSAPSNAVTPDAGASTTPVSVAQTLVGTGTVTTDPDGNGTSASVPLTTAVTVPGGGAVSIGESGAVEPAPTGFAFLGQEVTINAPGGAPAAPLKLVFDLNASIVNGIAPSSIVVFRTESGSLAAVPACTGAPGTASPDPCLSSAVGLGGGGARLTVLTSQASVWDFGVVSEPVVSIDTISKVVLGPSDSSTKVAWHADETGSFSVRVGGTSCSAGAVVASGNYSGAPGVKSTTVSSSALVEGPNTVRVCVTDSASRTSSVVAVVTKDTTPPVVTVEGASPALLGPGSTSTEVNWHASENGTFTVRVGGSGCGNGSVKASGAYGDQPGSQPSILDATGLANGANSIRVCVTDGAGNTGSATVLVTKDLAPPAVTINGVLPTQIGATQTATMTWHANENGTFAVVVGGIDCSTGTSVASGPYGSEPATTTSPVPSSALVEGANIVRVCRHGRRREHRSEDDHDHDGQRGAGRQDRRGIEGIARRERVHRRELGRRQQRHVHRASWRSDLHRRLGVRYRQLFDEPVRANEHDRVVNAQ